MNLPDFLKALLRRIVSLNINRPLLPLALAISVISVHPLAHSLEIPKGLTKSDREEVARILGLNTSAKSLSNPYPLGGYSGFEIGMSLEFINIFEISRLGCQRDVDSSCPNGSAHSDESELRFSRITIGKGIYNDVDLFIHFIPPFGIRSINDYGLMARWSFYQAKFLPISLSLLVTANQINFDNSFTSFNTGFDLISGVNIDSVSLYFGGGWSRANAEFMGGNEGSGVVDESDPLLEPTSNTTSLTVREVHSLIGLSIHFEDFFTAVQIDRYRDPVYSLKAGFRL